jgi:hypothetical protein
MELEFDASSSTVVIRARRRCIDNNPRNELNIPAVKIFSGLDLGKSPSFINRHRLLSNPAFSLTLPGFQVNNYMIILEIQLAAGIWIKPDIFPV